jgi:hypothetical protein
MQVLRNIKMQQQNVEWSELEESNYIFVHNNDGNL